MRPLFLIILGSSIFFSSCSEFHSRRIKGSGNVITQTRNISGFTAIDAGGAMNVFVRQDSAFSVKVEADDNLQQHVIVEEDNGVLHVHQENNTNLQATGDLKVYVTLPVIKDLQATGASTIVGENTFTGQDLNVAISGASRAELKLDYPNLSAEVTGASTGIFSGKAKDVKFTATGSSHLNCYDLFSETAIVEATGASEAKVFASVKLDAQASGASNVKYKGEATVNKDVSGASNVSKAE